MFKIIKIIMLMILNLGFYNLSIAKSAAEIECEKDCSLWGSSGRCVYDNGFWKCLG